MLGKRLKSTLHFAGIAASLLWLPGCEWPSRVTQPKENKPPEVYEVGSETQGLTLSYLWARTEQPAKIAIMFSVKNASGAPAKALACENFAVFEDSARVSIYESEYRVQSRPAVFKMHTLLLLDMSGSIVGERLDSLKAAAAAFVRTLLLGEAGANVDLGVYWFDGSENIHVLNDFTTDTSKILAALQSLNENLAADRSTNLHGAVIAGVARVQAEVQKQSSDEVAHGALVLFTDGTDRADRFSFPQAKAAVDSSGPHLSTYTIGLGDEIDAGSLQALGKDGYVYADSLRMLVPKFDETAMEIQSNIESRYLLEYCSPKRRGRHTLKVEATSTEIVGESGALTISFPADGFMGGCELEQPCLR